MKQGTKQKILAYLQEYKEATAKQLREAFGVSQVLIHRHLKTLCEEKKIQKIGSPPYVKYFLSEEKEKNEKISSKIIEENWLEILPNGEFLYGIKGFLHWCEKRNISPQEKVKEYEKMFREKEKWKQNGLIDATEKITASFAKSYLQKLWYVDFYSWEVFGKTLLGKLILYAKQNSDVVLMKKIAERVEVALLECIKRENFSDIILVPHSVPRKKDFLQTTFSYLPLSISSPRILKKIFKEHPVAQKTLKSKKDREQNAKETLFLETKNLGEKILLIDDACGSGATLNIAAEKIQNSFPHAKIFALAIVGSIKGFEVIAES